MSAVDPKSGSMLLWNALLAHGVSAEEATALMNGYAHELAQKIRTTVPPTAITSGGPYTNGVTSAADLIDPASKGAPK